jgi:hypothetical protein
MRARRSRSCSRRTRNSHGRGRTCRCSDRARATRGRMLGTPCGGRMPRGV